MKNLKNITRKINEDIDSPSITIERAKIIKRKYFLYKSYLSFYKEIDKLLSCNNKQGKIVELGSGGGFSKEIMPYVITSDIQKLPGIDMQFSATKLPFRKESLNAIFMVNVLHHIDDANLFFTEALRCLKPKGQIIMIEPANTLFGKFIYKYIHHEPYSPQAKWKFISHEPLSDANLALPWIIFYRDRKIFTKKYPSLNVMTLKSKFPFIYLLSGGFTLPQLLPNFCYPLICAIEYILTPIHRFIGLFYIIILEKK